MVIYKKTESILIVDLGGSLFSPLLKRSKFVVYVGTRKTGEGVMIQSIDDRTDSIEDIR